MQSNPRDYQISPSYVATSNPLFIKAKSYASVSIALGPPFLDVHQVRISSEAQAPAVSCPRSRGLNSNPEDMWPTAFDDILMEG